MRRLALQGSLRQWLTRLHRWSGLVVMLLLFIASATGVWLVFRQELDRALNARLRVVQPAPTRLSEDDIVRLIEQKFPDAMVSLVQFPRRPDDAVSLSLTARKGATRGRFEAVYVNQYTGDILGQRNTLRSGISRGSLDSLILGLHFQLLAGAWGGWVMGIAALVWLITNLIGLALSWPRLWLRVTSWMPILSVRREGTYKVNYDLHRASGTWLLPVLTVLAFTSVALNLPQYFRPIVVAFSPLTPRPTGTRVSPEATVVTFGQADAAVRRMFPEARTNNIFRDLNNGWHSVYFHLPEDPNPQGSNFALVDLKTGEINALRRPATGTGGDRFMAWLFPLHAGSAFGWTGRLLVALSGVVMVVLTATGLYLWWVKWRMRRRAHMTKRTISTAVIGIAALTALQAQTPYPRTFTDGGGHTVMLATKPARIASTVLGIDENLMDLVDPARIVAMTEIAKTMPDVSNIASRVPAAKAIVRGPQPVIDAKPDLVLTATYTDVQALVAAGMR